MNELDLTDYLDKAEPIVCRFADQVLTMVPKNFSTGSKGWYAAAKVSMLVGETYYPAQCSLIVTIVNSKKIACPQKALEGPQSDDLPLLDDVPPWNRSSPEGPILGQERAGDEETPEVEVNGKPKRSRKRKVLKT